MENMQFGLMVLAVGMTVVLTTLYVLSIVMNIFKALFYDRKNKAAAPVPAVAEAPAEEVAEEVDLSRSPQIVAAISAALAAYLGRQPVSFNVISVRKADSSWHEMGKQELISGNLTNKM